MAFRLYIVPVVGTGAHGDARRPKYFDDGTLPGRVWSWIDYGFEPWSVVGADLSASDDALVVGMPDVFALPFDLNPLLNAAQVTNVQNKLESINTPAGWVNTTLSWRQVVRTVLGMFSFIQRYGAKYAEANRVAAPSIFLGGVSLATTFGSLPLAVRNALTASAQSFGISTAGLTSATTLRTILKSMADNFQNKEYNFNGVLI